MDRPKLSLIDDKERYKKLEEAKKKYEDAIKKRSEFLTKSRLGEGKSLKQSLENYNNTSELDSNSPFLKRFDKEIEEAKKLKDSISMEKQKEGGIILKDSSGNYYRQPILKKKVKALEPDVESLNKMIKINKSGLKLIKPAVGSLALLGALGYSDLAGAATDAVIPGGVEELGQNDKEVLSDRQYRNANLIPNAGMLGGYTTDPDVGRYQEDIRRRLQRKK